MNIHSLDKYITNLTLRFSKKKTWKSITILFLLLISCSILPAFFSSQTETNGPNSFLEGMSILKKILLACVMAPIIETEIIYILIHLINKYLTKSIAIQIIISGIIFGLLHNYSFTYIIYGSLGGLVFCFGFCSYYYNRGFKTAFWSITLIHLLRNALPFLLRLI